jgi:O-acetyl-ADP-ribose deacetylase (regulator of RNase III)
MKFVFVDRDAMACSALKAVMPFADVRNCSLSDVPNKHFDVVFTPGNSYGFMDGGFDLAVRDRFPGVEQEIHGIIKQYYYGMLAVGQAFAVHAGNQKFVTYAPTMRVPMPIIGTDNVYWAFRAALMATRALVETSQVRNEWGAVAKLDEVRVLSSAFGTSAGQMTHVNAAHHMRLAIEHTMRTPEQVQQAHTWHGGWADHNQIQMYK